MSSKKTGVSDIIYELDNDDIEISSDDEVIQKSENHSENQSLTKPIIEKDVYVSLNEERLEVVNLIKSEDKICKITDHPNVDNFKENSLDLVDKYENSDVRDCADTHDNVIKNIPNTTTIFNEDIVIDSPASNSDLGVVGCENRTPIMTIKFRDQRTATNYKKKVKKFMLELIKLHDEHNILGSETETDLELDIWPEDINSVTDTEDDHDSLFFVDTAPNANERMDVPRYKEVTSVISNKSEKEKIHTPTLRRGPSCFNCGGEHPLRECTLPRDNARISENRKNKTQRVGRYHVEDDQKYGHLIPGRISGQLRHALGLKRHELPLHIYRMRVLGYPPGWLEEARISHSGITMFDSSGCAIMDPEDEEGQLCEPGSKDKFDIKKILDFPGFNVPASSRYKDEAHLCGLPPMMERDSKMIMLQFLAPNAMKAYKRKKLTFFPSASNNNSLQGEAEMELDSGDETADFPSLPPLPDEAPPPPPPPPVSPPPSNNTQPLAPDSSTSLDIQPTKPDHQKCSEDKQSPRKSQSEDQHNNIPLCQIEDKTIITGVNAESTIDREAIVDVTEGNIISTSEADALNEKFTITTSDRDSPTLDDLEEKKRLLLNALEGSDIKICFNDASSESTCIEKDFVDEHECNVVEEKADNAKSECFKNMSSEISIADSDSDIGETPNKKAKGHIKTTSYGTPVISVASPYIKLPSDDKFAKNICDVINFENLPNYTGKYKKICGILKKVKSEVDRINES